MEDNPNNNPIWSSLAEKIAHEMNGANLLDPANIRWIAETIATIATIQQTEAIEAVAKQPTNRSDRVGMPQTLLLQQFGVMLWDAFGEMPYHVGSSVFGGHPAHDVDVRILLNKEKYAKMGFGNPLNQHENPRWVAYTLAFSLLGKQITGLPIDFQIQETEWANANFTGPRSALCVGLLCRQNRQPLGESQ